MIRPISPTPFLGSTLIISFMVLLGCQASPTSRTEPTVKVRSAHGTWIDEQFQTAILNIGLEKLGYQPETPKEIDYSAIYISVANGDLDYSPSNYELNHKEFFDNAGGSEKMERVGVLVSGTFQSYYLDKKTAEQYNITNIQQLKEPKLAKLFDSDGNGKANLIGCNPGWGCELIIEHHMAAYDLRETVEHNRGRYDALIADTITRYQQGERVLYYAYYPSWVSAILKPTIDVIRLTVPFTDLPEELKNVTAAETSIAGKNYGFPVNNQRVFANKKFLAANPVAKRWFELVKIPVEDMSTESLRLREGEDRPEDIRRHAQEWIENNQALVDGWLAEARKATP
ncbi:MAG: glycine betaine/L-proline ABC transporter substrate-binding protein ProX [Symploca sp. SIO1A3]|nr:glycine betaine/L-proline ABC transporter substrate-binding protein ProX [Symploca sp. SIO1A3]